LGGGWGAKIIKGEKMLNKNMEEKNVLKGEIGRGERQKGKDAKFGIS
jgi:hypothetical protein